MKAIWTKFLPATNVRGSRIKASAEGCSKTVDYPHGTSAEGAHDRAAVVLCSMMGWPGTLIRGVRPDGLGYVYVFESRDERVSNPTPSYAEQEARRANTVRK